jgi:hypothetical protein
MSPAARSALFRGSCVLRKNNGKDGEWLVIMNPIHANIHFTFH